MSLKVHEINVSDLIPYENNPRKNSAAIKEVAESIKKFGYKVPIVVNRENIIITGHTRYEALQMLGIEKVPVIYADDLTEEQERAFRIADNKTAELASWDFERLEEELASISDEWMDELFKRKEKELLSDEMDEDEDFEVDLSEYGNEAFKYVCQCCGYKFN